MADGGYIYDEDLSEDFLEWENFSHFRTLGADEAAFVLTTKAFKISDDELKRIIEKCDNKDDAKSN